MCSSSSHCTLNGIEGRLSHDNVGSMLIAFRRDGRFPRLTSTDLSVCLSIERLFWSVVRRQARLGKGALIQVVHLRDFYTLRRWHDRRRAGHTAHKNLNCPYFFKKIFSPPRKNDTTKQTLNTQIVYASFNNQIKYNVITLVDSFRSIDKRIKKETQDTEKKARKVDET